MAQLTLNKLWDSVAGTGYKTLIVCFYYYILTACDTRGCEAGQIMDDDDGLKDSRTHIYSDSDSEHYIYRHEAIKRAESSTGSYTICIKRGNHLYIPELNKLLFKVNKKCWGKIENRLLDYRGFCHYWALLLIEGLQPAELSWTLSNRLIVLAASLHFTWFLNVIPAEYGK